MPPRATDIDTKARALIEAELAHIAGENLTDVDKRVAKQFGVSVRTLQRWRTEMREDQELADRVAYTLNRARDEDTDNWIRKSVSARVALLDYAARVAQNASTYESEVIEAVSKLFQAIADSELAFRVLDESVATNHRADEAADNPASWVPAQWGGDGSSHAASA